ncbi:MAG: polysaccharide biosynthesis/export family protein [Armatimonadetes bacterium]|nr:polysaccharide biosynthesis/export family protein [Armatimonadota bacterium]
MQTVSNLTANCINRQNTLRPVSAICFVFGVALWGVSTGAAAQSPVAPIGQSPVAEAAVVAVRILAGDTVTVEVFGKPELSRSVSVGTDGKITYPLLGDLKAAGRTAPELAEALRAGLSKELNNPQVTVTIAKRLVTRVGVLGAVRQPGKFVLEEGWRVLDLLAEAGGLLIDRPEWVQTTLVRASTGTATPVDLVRLLGEADATQNHRLEPGDVLLVREKDATKTRIQILGAVAKPGTVSAPADGSIVTALIEAGGIIPRAKLAEASIRRGNETIAVDLSSLSTDGTLKAVGANPVPKLLPGDTLLIPLNALSYSVIGAVAVPGTRELHPEKPVTALGALFGAGGATPECDLKNASVVRLSANGEPQIFPINLENGIKNKKNNTKPGKGDAPADVVLLTGDVLYLPTKGQGRNRTNVLREAMSFLPFAGFFVR